MRNDKYASDLSMEDVSKYVAQMREQTGQTAVVVLHFGDGPCGKDWAEVRVVPWPAGRLEDARVIQRGEMPGRSVARVPRILLHLIAQAFDQLESVPWLWSEERRRRARGDDA